MIERASFTAREPIEEELAEAIHTTLQSNLNNHGWQKLVDQSHHLLIKEIHVKHFMPHNNSLPNILQTIATIKFSQLQQINIETNNITSIEGLSRVDMGSLDHLWFSVNDVSSIRELRKIHWPELTSIGLNKNRIQEGHWVTFMHLPNLARNTVFELSAGDGVQSQDLSWTAKMMAKPAEESKGEIQIKFNSKQRIKQPPVRTALSRRHKYMALIYAS